MATPKMKAISPTLAVSKAFVHSSFDVVNDHKMKEWVRNLAMELIRRLVADQKKNRRAATELLVILMSGTHGKELRATFSLPKYECPLIISPTWDFMNENSDLKDPNGAWLITHIHIAADNFKELAEPKGSMSRWLSSAKRPDVMANSGEESVPVSIGSRVPLPVSDSTPISSRQNEVVEADGEDGARDADSVVPSSSAGEVMGVARQAGVVARNKRGRRNKKVGSKKVTATKKEKPKRTKATRDLVKAAYGCRKMTEFLVPDVD